MPREDRHIVRQRVQLRADGFSYDTYRTERDERMPARSDDEVSAYSGSVFHFHRIDLRFLNASPHPELRGLDDRRPDESVSVYLECDPR